MKQGNDKDNQKIADWVKLFNSVTSMASMGVHVVDLATREMYFSNEAGFRLINEEPCDYKGRTCYEVFFGLNHPCENCRLEHTKQGITRHEAYVPEAGRTFLTNTEITTWEGKDVLIEYITDITELKKKEQEFKTAEEIYQKRIESIMQTYPNSLGALVINLTKDRVTSQKRFHSYIREQSDSSISEYLGMQEKLMPEIDFKRYQKTFSRQNLINLYEEGEQQVSLTHRYHFMDKTRWITTSARIITNPNTKDIEALVCAVDDTEKILSEQVIQKLINIRYDLLALIYPKEEYVDFRYVGKEFEGLPETSIDHYEKNRKQSARLFQEEDMNRYEEKTDMQTIVNNLNESGNYTFTLEMHTEEGIHHKCYTYNYLSEDREIILVTIQDVTESHEKEQEQMQLIKTALSQAENANAAKTDFLSRMSHDMRTPLNGILGMLALMKDQELPEDISENLRQIQMSGKYLLNLINDTLDISKIESNRIELHENIIDEAKIVENINTNAHLLAADKGVNFVMEKINYENSEPMYLKLDESRVEQIFMNLISNAVKFTPVGGDVYFKVQRLEITDTHVRKRFEIADNGIGMSKEFQKHIFEPFSQEGRVETERENGTGLGMAIVHRLVELMGGTIEVKSELNKGTTFILEMRFDKYTGSAEQVTGEQTTTDVSLEGKRVLLCEDHPLNRQIAMSLLDKKGIIVDAVENGKEGLTKFEQSKPGDFDLILMDLRMPIMGGFEATKKIRKLHRADASTIPIIAMTANAFDEDVKQCLEAGMNGHIAKPLDVQKMYETIARWVGETDKKEQ